MSIFGSNKDVKTLMDLGFTKEQVNAALK